MYDAIGPIDRSTTVRWYRGISPALISALTLLATALVLRFANFENPIAGLDEQYYLLVGERMWQGAIPYLDLWDRKPFGLFILFAGINLLPGDGVLAAGLVATIFAAATALVVALIARRTVGWVPATMAGAFYLAGLGELWGNTPQTPVFYNLGVAIAALLILVAIERPTARKSRRMAVVAMAVVGLAMQIKTNAVLEGALFGLIYLAALWRSSRNVWKTASTCGAMALAGVAPTLAVMGYFLQIGAFAAWWQANITSVLAKGRPDDAAVVQAFVETMVLTIPALVLMMAGVWLRTRRFVRCDRDTMLFIGWVCVAFADFMSIGGYAAHYALPLLLATAPLAATVFALRRVGPVAFAVVMLMPVLQATMVMPGFAAKDIAYERAVVAAMPADVATRCLYIHEGPVAYYQLTHACLVTRFAFTAHISAQREAHALGVDPAAALDAALDRAPGTVMTLDAKQTPERNVAIERRLLDRLRQEYHVTARLPYRYYDPDARLILWRRNS